MPQTPDLLESLKSSYSLRPLQELYQKYFNSFINDNHEYFLELGVDQELFTDPLQKTDLIHVLLKIFSDKELFQKLLNSLPQHINKVFEKLTWEGEYDAKDLEHELGEVIVINDGYTGDSTKNLHPDYFFFCFTRSEGYDYKQQRYSTHFKLYLPDPVRQLVKEHFPSPEGYDWMPVVEPPQHMTSYINNDQILHELPAIAAYIERGLLKFGQNGTVLKSSLREIFKHLDSPEFYPNSEGKQEFLRTELIVKIMNAARPLILNSSPLSLSKQIFSAFESHKTFPFLELMLTHLKGRNKINQQRTQNINPQFVTLIASMPEGEWLSIDNILRFVRLRGMNLNVIDEQAAKRHLYIDQKSRWHDTSRVSSDNYVDIILNPLLKSGLFLMGALGLMDLAFTSPRNEKITLAGKEYLSVYDGLEYIRLTKVGAFLIGKSKSLELSTQNGLHAKAILDETRLVLTLSQADKIKSMLLEKFCLPVGALRYRMDHRTFLKDCDSLEEIQEKINLFRREICDDLPPCWKEFFDQTLTQFNPVRPCPELEVYKLADDEQLIQLIAQDEVLQKYILKSEQFHIIVDQKNFPKVQKRLQQWGYLLQ